MSLVDWLNEGRLKAHTSSSAEISQLLAVFDRDIRDSSAAGISLDLRFATAYSAALAICTAALAASGYRTSGEGHHFVSIQSLAFTMAMDAPTIERFNRFRRKRNLADYERVGAVSEVEVAEMTQLARELRARFDAWLRSTHPDLSG